MANTTKIEVNAVDNELILIASTGRGSHILCHLKSGFNAPVSYVFNPGHILPPGTYDLTAIGINWGGPWKFNVVLTPAITGFGPVSGTGGAGVVFSHTASITVP
jgi:hypothetical protein